MISHSQIILMHIKYYEGTHDSSVGIVTRLRVGRPRIHGILSPKVEASHTTTHTQLCVQCVLRVVCHRDKSARQRRRPVTPPSAKITDKYGYTFISSYVYMDCTATFIFNHHHSTVCLTTGPQPLRKRLLHSVRSSASSFSFRYLLDSLRPSSIWVRLLPRLLVPYFFSFHFSFNNVF
jgi:hypothetical protein